MLKIFFLLMVMMLIASGASLTTYSLVGGSALIIFFFLSPFTFVSNFFKSLFFLDLMSWSLILMTFILLYTVMIVSSSEDISSYPSVMGLYTIMGLALTFCFSSVSFFLFFFFFEFLLFPIFFLILGWGYQPERMSAGVSMMLYTVFASLPLLFSLMVLFDKGFSWSILLLSQANLFSPSNFETMFLCLMLILSFLVKFPMYGFHLWLPKAHVEAPVGGSMILAGVLLKLAGYGIFRLSLFILSHSSPLVGGLLIFGVAGGVFSSIICSQQSDMKVLIAYSSVGHMSMSLAGLVSGGLMMSVGALFMLLAHGFTSSAMFFLANITYKRSHSRNMIFSGGVMSVLPWMSFWWALGILCNMSAPPTLNLISEMLIFAGLANFSFFFVFPLGLMIFLGAVYNVFLYNSLNHGQMNLGGSSLMFSMKEADMIVLWNLIIFPICFLLILPILGYF